MGEIQVPKIFSHQFLPTKNRGKFFFDFGSQESVCAVMGLIYAEKCTFFT